MWGGFQRSGTKGSGGDEKTLIPCFWSLQNNFFCLNGRQKNIAGKGVCMFGAAVLTASDRGSRGEREDKSGKVIEEIVQRLGGKVLESALVPDDPESIREKLIYFADQLKAEVILTTGGTGLSPRDNTPEATLSVIEKVVPGLSEVMRAESLKKTPHAMLSRAVCGVRGNSLIINLPGSPKAVRECLEFIEPALPHAIELMKGQVSDCAQGEKQ